MGLLDEAILSFRRAIQFNPDSAEACNNLGATLIDQGYDADAEIACQTAVELKPNYVQARNNLGQREARAKRGNSAARSSCLIAMPLRHVGANSPFRTKP